MPAPTRRAGRARHRGSRRRSRALLGVAVGSAALTTAIVVADRRAHRRGGNHELRGLPEGSTSAVDTDDGARLAVTVAGPDAGPTVVLAHCWTGSRLVWAEVAARLVEAGHRVVLYDQRGHGESLAALDSGPSIAQLGHDLRAVLDATGTTDAVLVGHSMGGMTIQSYALEHAEHFAAHTRGVVLVATAARVLGRTVPGRLVQRALGDGRLEWTRQGTLGRRMVRGALGRGASWAHVELTRDLFAATTGPARAGYLLAMATMDLRPVLASIAVPTTVLVGSRDTLTPPRLARQLVAGLPDAELLVLPGAGHMLPLEAPDRVVEAILATVARADDRVAVSAGGG